MTLGLSTGSGAATLERDRDFFLPNFASVLLRNRRTEAVLDQTFQMAAKCVPSHAASLSEGPADGHDLWKRREDHLVATFGDSTRNASKRWVGMAWTPCIPSSLRTSRIVKCGGIVERLAVDLLFGAYPEARSLVRMRARQHPQDANGPNCGGLRCGTADNAHRRIRAQVGAAPG